MGRGATQPNAEETDAKEACAEGAEPSPAPRASIAAPRRPQRANGAERYRRLIAATEAVLAEGGPDALTIQAIAKRAEAPMASVYHFFPTPAAAAVALAETYLAEIAGLIGRGAETASMARPADFVIALIRATVGFYAKHPHAGPLFFDSAFAWHIRRCDLENNRRMAVVVADVLASRADEAEADLAAVDLTEMVETAIALADAVWSLSFARHGAITPAAAAEAERAVAAYVEAALS